MKKPEWKLGKAFTLVTIAYLICSVFGCTLYMVLPPVLCSVGARSHAYLLFIAALDSTENLWPQVWTVIGHLYVLAMVISGILAMKTGKCRLFFLLVALEIAFTVVFLAAQGSTAFEYTSGVLLNLGYCIWLWRKAFPKAVISRKK